MKPYSSYKPSGTSWLGNVPAHWVIKRVKHIAQFHTGWTPPTGDSASYIGTNFWANIGDLGAPEIEETKHCISDEAVTKAGITVSPIGSLLFSFKLSVGQVSIAKVPLYTNEAIATFPPQDGFETPWAFYAFPAFIPKNAAVNIYGAQLLNQQRINDAVLLVPPTDEQRAIADYLDIETARIDDLIQEKNVLIELLRECQAGVFETLLSERTAHLSGVYDPRCPWLVKMPTIWERVKVKHLVQSFDQGISPQCESRPPDEHEWGVLKVGCVNSGIFDPSESKALPPDIDPISEITLKQGDVMVSRANTKNLVGRAAMADKDYPKLMLSDKLYRIKIDIRRCMPAFLVGILTLPAVRVRIEERATGASASMLNIDRRTILELDLALPPIQDQETVLNAAQVETKRLRDLIAHARKELNLLKELRAATIADAVLGRIDVRTTSAQAHPSQRMQSLAA